MNATPGSKQQATLQPRNEAHPPARRPAALRRRLPPLPLLLSLLCAAAAANGQGNIPIERAQREYQARFCFTQGYYCLWPNRSCCPAPPFPPDGFYGDLEKNPQLGKVLVQDLISQFNYEHIYTWFLYSTNGVQDIEGWDPELQSGPGLPPPGYALDDPSVPVLDPSAVTDLTDRSVG
jgi:hypothetical protein